MSSFPDYSLEEKLKYKLVPPGLYIHYLYRKALRRGERETGLLPYLARPDRVSLDIGANKGVYAYALLRCSAAVCAFEPNPKSFNVLQSWARNKVRLFACPLAECNGRADYIFNFIFLPDA